MQVDYYMDSSKGIHSKDPMKYHQAFISRGRVFLFRKGMLFYIEDIFMKSNYTPTRFYVML